MLKKLLPILILALFAVSAVALQQEAAPRIEITGVNPSDLPTVIVTANILDAVGQPARALTIDNFSITGELVDRASIVQVQNVTDDDLPISVVLLIDVSSSMDGVPIQRAREAAQAFIGGVGDNDTVAVMTFGSAIEVVQSYTEDKTALSAAIDSVFATGQTALYQGAFDAVDLAAESPTPRRAVILLSDGAEFGGVSQVERGAALEEARIRGVPVYTIGLGFGTDRTYLQELAGGTNARFVESPDPEQLLQIYTDLAALLRTQYVLTIEANLPPDGSEYDLGVQVTTDEGSASATTTLRAPIPVPLVSAPSLPPLTEPTEITADIAADDDIERVVFQLGEGEAVTDTAAPYSILVDPNTLPPGTYPLSISASDVDGDVGTAAGTIEIAVLPPQVTLVFNTDEPLREPQTVSVEVGGQSEAVSVAYRIDEGEPVILTEAPFSFTVDPFSLLPGAHTLTVEVANATGGGATAAQPFEVASLPPRFEITGLSAGQVLDQTTRLGINVIQSQTPVTSAAYTVNFTALAVSDDFGATLDPLLFPAGNATLNVSATNENGETAEQSRAFVITALPPQITLRNLRAGEPLAADRTVGVELLSQSEVLRVDYFIDDTEVDERGQPPFDFVINVLDVGAGEHTLRVEALNAGGELGSAEINFIVTDAPIATATQAALNATGTAIVLTQVEMDARATSAQATLDAGATLDAQATGTQVALDLLATQQSGQATGTAVAAITGTVAAQRTASAFSATAEQATLDANSTLAAAGTATAESAAATQGAIATTTQEVILSATAVAVEATQAANATSTGEARATASQQAAVVATATAVEATRAARTAEAIQATQDAAATATADANATVTSEAGATATLIARQTQRAASATREAAMQAQGETATAESAQMTLTADATDTERAATRAALATTTGEAAANATRASLNSTATQQAAEQSSQATATEAAVQRSIASTATAIQNAAATGDARATLQAQQTESAAAATATEAARSILLAQADAATQAAAEAATRSAAATGTANARETATVNAALTQTQQARETATVNAALTQTQQAHQTATTSAEAAQTQTQQARETAFAEAQATATARSNETATAAAATEEESALPTEEVTPTPDEQLTAAAAATMTQSARETATSSAETTETQVAQAATEAAPSPTATVSITPSLTPTLVSIELEGQTADTASQLIPILIVALVVIVILFIIFLILRRQRQDRDDRNTRRRRGR